MALRALLVAVVAAATITGCGGGGGSSTQEHATPLAQAQTRAFREKGFNTSVPAGWHQRRRASAGERIYFLNSGSGHANDLGLAAPGEIGLTIARQRALRGQSARAALATIAATPDGATGVARSHPIKQSQLDGSDAATTQFTYTYNGATYIQSNIVAIYRGVLVFIEVDAEPYRASDAQRIMSTVTGNWHWSRPAGVVVS
jgi:hypothetical protein